MGITKLKNMALSADVMDADELQRRLALKANEDDVDLALGLRVLKSRTTTDFTLVQDGLSAVVPADANRFNSMTKLEFDGQERLVATGDWEEPSRGIWYAGRNADGKWEWQRSSIDQEFAPYLDLMRLFRAKGGTLLCVAREGVHEFDANKRKKEAEAISRVYYSEDGGVTWKAAVYEGGNPMNAANLYTAGAIQVGDRVVIPCQSTASVASFDGLSDAAWDRYQTFVYSEDDGKTWKTYKLLTTPGVRRTLAQHEAASPLDDRSFVGGWSYQSVEVGCRRYVFEDDGTISHYDTNENGTPYGRLKSADDSNVNCEVHVFRQFSLDASHYDKTYVIATSKGIYTSDDLVKYERCAALDLLLAENNRNIRNVFEYDGLFYLTQYKGYVLTTVDFRKLKVLRQFSKEITGLIPDGDGVWAVSHKPNAAEGASLGFSVASSVQKDDYLVPGSVGDVDVIEEPASATAQEVAQRLNELINALKS